jgi:hypothetical protein
MSAEREGKEKRADAAAKPGFARLTINLPNGPVLAAIKREAAKEDLSLS